MSPTTWFKLLFLIVLSISIAVGCLARGDVMEETVVDEFEQALQRFPGSPEGVELGLARFAECYRDLTHDALAERVGQLYAEELYFNDTLHSFSKRADLVEYMSRTGAALKESKIEIKQTVVDGNDVFVRWTMEFHTRAAGRTIQSKSIGMSQLRFNEQGQIVLHQDFWDSGHALYAHLPIVGFAVRRARDRM